ncbi:MAG TPA: cyclopropane-fatty-acyl-phospholipid synthase family protein [Azospira sp.]|nr:cyclopropane-fatty-acyl-phospholipid synthase family protein [Azospira sp.]
MNTLDSTLRPLGDALTVPDGRLPRAASTVFRLLESLRGGSLDLRLPGGDHLAFGQGVPVAAMEVHDPALFAAVLAEGDIGLAGSYIDGGWDSPDLARLLTLFADNRTTLTRAVYGSFLRLLAARLRHALNANTRQGARRNIMAHYDLGNDFYRLWLDPTMSYSAALYGDSETSMAAAQQAKYRRILHRLGVRPGQRILEIGCGWGGFAELAASEAGAEVHGVTLSPAQLAWAQARMRAAGVDDRVTLELRDYRDLAGQYDHIVSIEMFEAVGERWWPTYFASVARLLKPEGRALIQTITIRDDLFARYRRGTDFIQQQVFPGGMLPSPQVFARGAGRAGLALRDDFAFGPDYARTLAGWLAAFDRAWPEIARLGFDERFRRLWRFYLAYCEAGFRSGCTDVRQFALAHAR